MSIRRPGILFGVLVIPAIALSGSAAALPVSQEDQAQILAQVDSLHVTGQVATAAATIEPFLTEARAAADSTFILPLVSKLGRLYASFGQPKKGEPLLREAARLAEVLEDSLRWCDALRWLGYSVEQQGRLNEADIIYRKQLTISESRQDPRHEAWARVGLAYGDAQKGRYPEAAEEYRRAVVLFEDLADTAAAVWTLNGLGAALELNGEYALAAATYQEVAHLARLIGYRAVEALAQNNTGALEYSLGDPGVALDHFRWARQLQLQISQIQDAVSTGANEANCLLQLGRSDEAASLLEDLLKECEQGNFVDRESTVLGVLADVRRAQGRPREAVSIYRRILARDDESLDLQSRIKTVTGYAATLADMDSSAVALDAMLQEDNKRGRIPGTAGVEFELALGNLYLATGQPEAALKRFRFTVKETTAADLHRHRVLALAGAAGSLRALGRPHEALVLLRDAARAWEDTRIASTDPKWREQRGASGRLVYTQMAAVILEVGGPDSTAAAFDAVQIFKARTLAERIGSREKDTDQRTATLELVQKEILAEDELFLDAYLGPAESVMFAVTPSECRAIMLPDEKTLARRLHLFHEMLATAPAGHNSAAALQVAQAAGEQLSRDLLGSAYSLVAGSARIVYAPDGPLNLVPFSTMVPDPVWVRIPSATILLYSRHDLNQTTARGRGILAVAGAETSEGRPLPGAIREVRFLAREYQGVDLRVAGQTNGRLLPENLAGYDILHLATHARIDDQRPWRSEIILDARAPEGRIQADRIAEMSLRARLAVLSACETGAGRILSGEGVLGLSSAFLSAGVPTVVASLWPVADGVTAALMKGFYAELAAGWDPAIALSRAQEMIQSDPKTAHPFHWAGFVVVGDGSVILDLEPRNRARTVAGFIAALAVIIFLGVMVFRRLAPPKNLIPM